MQADPADPYAGLKEKAPGINWDRKAPSGIDEYADIISKCQGCLKEGPKVVRMNGVTFAKYVAMRLRATTNAPHADAERRAHFEIFNVARGLWITRH